MAAPACPPAVDEQFGPWAGSGCRGGFDFTLHFEESILALPILCLFLALFPLRLLRLARSVKKARTSSMLWLKLVRAVENLQARQEQFLGICS